VAAAGVAVYVMLKAARLMSETSAAVAGLRERGDLLIERANATIDQAGEQIARTGTVTASMAGVTAAMAELGGQVAAVAPALPAAGATSGPLAWAAALAYGVRWALGNRGVPGGNVPRPTGHTGRWGHWADRPRAAVDRPGSAVDRPGSAAVRPGTAAGRPGRDAGRRAALASRGNGTPR
jgi:hypothetical protein